MARSKFPGKPSKQMNKRRINVLTAASLDVTQDEGEIDVADLQHKAEEQVVRKTKRRRRLLKDLDGRRRSFNKQCMLIAEVTATNIRKTKMVRKSIRSGCSSNGTKRSEQGVNKTLRKLTRTKQPLLETSNLVGKFVLPSRSVHSSRVIKPNKRFINVEAINNMESISFRKRVVNKSRNSIKLDCSNDKSVVKCVSQTDTARTLCATGDNNCNSHKLESDPVIPRNCSNRIILRQARLQLHTQTPTGPEGPFSSTSTPGNTNPPGTVTCGVCGAVRFYRFVKQARKFHIYSCESCRKFISKMIKRQMCNEKSSSPPTTLPCLKGQGMCHVPPIVRSQQWKLFRCAYRARCPACWLKMCLRSFQMPTNLKQSLAEFLPEYMRGQETRFNNCLSLFSFHTNASIDTKAAQLSPNISNSEPEERVSRHRSFRKKHSISPQKSLSTNSTDVKRQIIDLKGPRVKHVCRSASIVLGQPVATFPSENEKKASNESLHSLNKRATTKSPDVKSSNTDIGEDKENNFGADNKAGSPLNITSSPLESENLIGSSDEVKSNFLDLMTTKDFLDDDFEAKSCKTPKEKNAIYIDFWECYDPEEVSRSGFGLTAYEPFPVGAICFLCGSAGKEPLLYCCVCCEPYHSYCLDQAPRNYSTAFDWLCPKCTSCNFCGKLERHKVHCQKCQKAYHPECLNSKIETSNHRMICSSCLRCKGCGSDNVTKFMGNLPLCLICFKIRKKENFCPLCKASYDDNEMQLKMLECVKCNKWIHAKCESVSNEEYQIISLLPESVKFTCCICESSPQWRRAVISQLRANFNYILRRLSKNRLAREALKCSSFNRFETNEIDLNSELNNNFSKSQEKSKVKSNMKPSDSEKLEQESLNVPSVLNIKNKLISNEYSSVSQFNKNMEEFMECTNSKELSIVYQEILKQIFPWYDSSQVDTHSSNFSEEEITRDDMWLKTDQVQIKPSNEVADNRICILCKGVSDGTVEGEARLLYCGGNEWIHGNCALWSNEVYEEIDGSLQNVHKVISKAASAACTFCKRNGASLECYAKSCNKTYHFACARQDKCHFLQDKTFYCTAHSNLNCSTVITSPSEFSLRRLLYVEMDKKKTTKINPDKVHFMVGSLSVTKLGKVLSVSDHVEALIPIGFTCERLFWSTTEPWKLVPYVITTSLLDSHHNGVLVDRNFTVDHTLPKTILERKLKELSFWQKEYDKDNSAINFNEFEEEEEPQNENAAPDILSPELTDAILKELPHEFLDRISMQDIFPKLLNNEDLLTLDVKASDLGNSNENCLNKITRIELEKGFLELEDDSFKKVKNGLGKDKLNKCGLSVNDTISPPLKMRRLSRDKNLFLKYVQLDGAYDSSSGSDGESELPEHSDEPVKCDRCQCTYRTQASYKRHLESCEVLSTSDSESEIVQDQGSPILVSIVSDPSRENECQAYRTSTYEAALNTQTETYVSTQSESEIISVSHSSDGVYSNYMPIVEEKMLIESYSQAATTGPSTHESNLAAISYQAANATIYNQTGTTMNQSATFPVSQLTASETNICVNSPTTLFINQPNTSNVSFVQSPPVSVNQSTSISLNPVGLHPSQLTVQSVPITPDINPVINIAANNSITVGNKIIATPNVVNSLMSQTFSIPQTQFFKSPQKIIRPRGRPRSLAAKRTKLPLFQNDNSNSASVVVQQLPSTNMIPTFLETFQQQTGQNLHYVATINPQMQIAPSVTSQPQLLQLQPEGTLLNIVPSVQPTVLLPQTRVLGEQLIMDSGSLVWTTQQVQPVFYGFETIVQNTVMQSQQFMPSTMPGVLTANSSYSSTTQVFQTSKLEPILDVTSGNIVLVNPGTAVVGNSPVSVQQSMALPSTLIQPKSTWVPAESEIKVTSSATLQTKPLPPPATVASNVSCASINLPMAPFAVDSGVPRNVVNPTLKTTPTVQARPMSRVLPMPTNQIKKVQPKSTVLDKPNVPQVFEKPDQIGNPKKILILEDVLVKPMEEEGGIKKTNGPSDVNKELKQIIQKEVEEGLCKHKNFKAALPILTVKSINGKQPCMPQLTNVPLNKSSSSAETSRTLPVDVKCRLPSTATPVRLTASRPSVPSSPALRPPPPFPRCSIISVRPGNGPLRPVTSLRCPNTIARRANFSSITPVNVRVSTCPTRPSTIPPISTQSPSTLAAIPQPPTPSPSPLSSAISLPTTADNIPSATSHYIPKADTKHVQENKENSILYTVETRDGFRYSSTSLSELSAKIFDAVQAARIANNMQPLPMNSLGTLELLGLKTNGLKFLLEQQPGVGRCTNYKTKFHTDPYNFDTEDDSDFEYYPFSAARCRVHKRISEPTDMFGWLTSKHRKPSKYISTNLDLITKRSAVTSLPMAVRFRQLKATWKKSVGVFPSKIHKRGLFCLRDIENGEMVIEYTGEVIKSAVVDKREKEYQTKDVGCYMFKIDENIVVDATRMGNAARFINHSCDPNCYSKVIELQGRQHIVIFANRKILRGEELTYDYQFPLEDDKIPCSCGTTRCRKFLN